MNFVSAKNIPYIGNFQISLISQIKNFNYAKNGCSVIINHKGHPRKVIPGRDPSQILCVKNFLIYGNRCIYLLIVAELSIEYGCSKCCIHSGSSDNFTGSSPT